MDKGDCMRIFEHWNKGNVGHPIICPICGTQEDKPCCLIAIEGTEEGHIVEAFPVHVHCLDFTMRELVDGRKLIYQMFVAKEGVNQEKTLGVVKEG
jgi:hypothetical protein